MPEKRRKKSLKKKTEQPKNHGDAPDTAFLEKLAGELHALFTIEGVEGVGEPVTLISPADLRPDLLGFVERLRGGAIELDEEMLLITLAVSARPRQSDPVLKRLQQALVFLGRYAMDKGVSADAVLSLLDKTKRQLSRSR